MSRVFLKKSSFFVEKNIDFPKNLGFSDFKKHRFSLKSGVSKNPLHLPFQNLSSVDIHIIMDFAKFVESNPIKAFGCSH